MNVIKGKSVVLWLVAVAFFMQMLDGTVLNISLPSIAKAIGEDPLKLQSIIVVYMLTVAFFIPFSGWLADRFGTRRIFMLAIMLFSLGSLSCAMSETLEGLIFSRIFQGIGGALLVPVGRLIIIKLFPPEEFVKALSFIMLPALLGPLLGPSLGGFLVEYATWHWIFLINIPIGIVELLLCFKYMPDAKDDDVSSFDTSGFLLFGAGAVMFALSFENSEALSFSLKGKFFFFIASQMLFLLYFLHSRRSKNPLFNPKMFKCRPFSVGIVANVWTRLFSSSMSLLVALFLQLGLGYSPGMSGLILLTLGVSAIAGKILINPLILRFGFRDFLFCNTIMLGASIILFYSIDNGSSIYHTISVLFLIGILNSFQFTGLVTVTLIELPKSYYSQGNSLLSVIMQLAMGAGISLGMIILSFFSEGIDRTDVVPMERAFRNTFIVTGTMTVLTSLVFLLLKKNTGKRFKKAGHAEVPVQALP